MGAEKTESEEREFPGYCQRNKSHRKQTNCINVISYASVNKHHGFIPSLNGFQGLLRTGRFTERLRMEES